MISILVFQFSGVNLEKVRTAVEEYVGRGPDAKILHPIPFTPRLKTVLVTAQKEARSLCHTYVGTEHILLGLLCENEGVAGRVLESFGLDVSQTRQEILKELDPNFLGGGELSQG